MQDKNVQARKNAMANGEAAVPVSISQRVLNWMRRAWRPAASGLAVALALLLLWHGVSGKNGLLIWQQKRAEDRQLRKEIDDLQRENARLRNQNERLNSSPDAIGQVAREQLHYAKPNEVIVKLSPEKNTPIQPAGAGK
ncbi:MAG: FtsB family cell division protein [Terracidiphilus sp.]